MASGTADAILDRACGLRALSGSEPLCSLGGSAKTRGTADAVPLTVRRLSGELVGNVDVFSGMTVQDLMDLIAEAGGPAQSEQQLVLGHDVLGEKDDVYELADKDGSGMLFVVTIKGCPSCEGPCCCVLCHCQPCYGLVDYYGVCKACGKSGGHASKCQYCAQQFPSLCALDTHVRFVHPENFERGDWNCHRFEDHIRKREMGQARAPPRPEKGTFEDALRGGLGASGIHDILGTS